MTNYKMSDCLTFGLVILFLLGALIAGPSLDKYPQNIPFLKPTDLVEYSIRMMPEAKKGIIEQFSKPFFSELSNGFKPNNKFLKL